MLEVTHHNGLAQLLSEIINVFQKQDLFFFLATSMMFIFNKTDVVLSAK